MKQPKVIKIICRKDPALVNVLEDTVSCIIQKREADDDSKIVYIENPKYVKNTKDLITGAPYIALTQYDYEVVEWTE